MHQSSSVEGNDLKTDGRWTKINHKSSRCHFVTGELNIYNGEQEHKLCENGIEKSVPRDHLLSSLGKLHDAKW